MLTTRALQQRIVRRIRELARARGVPLARLPERAGVSRFAPAGRADLRQGTKVLY